MPAANTTDPVLEICDLRIEGRSGGNWSEIVKGVSLSLQRGQVMGLIGESGAGKSTIGLAALGYARPGCRFSGGQVRFCGEDLLGKPHEELRRLRGVRIAYVAQSAAAFFNPAHRLIDQFTEVMLTHGVTEITAARAKAVQLYARLELPDPENFGRRYPHQVSGGQLQRAMIAMAMACDPDLIVFDEPTTALDVTTQVGVLAAVKKAVAGSKSAALYITHDLAVVAQLADRIMVLRNGTCVEEGASVQVLEQPTQDYTRSLLSSHAVAVQERHRQGPILEVEDIFASYGSQRILGGVSFAASRGSTVAIVGESGSGKSTLARVIAGLMPTATGRVKFEGKQLPMKLARRDRTTLQRLQMIYQSPDTALNPRQRVGEILGRPLTFYSGVAGTENARRVVELLDQVELKPEIAERFPGELSGGQKQRICIARALASAPELIICDEVTSGLDPLVAKGVLSLLARLQAEMGTTYLFITHDLKIVEAIADDVVVMNRGQIVDQGTKRDVMSPPYAPYTEKLLAAVPQMNTNWLDQRLLAR